jgi:hypothetical protein
VDRLYARLVEIGAIIVDPPAEYPEYGAGYYAVFFADPDGRKLEYVFTPRPALPYGAPQSAISALADLTLTRVRSIWRDEMHCVKLVAAVAVLSCAGAAHADVVPGLFNTGVNASGTPLPGLVADPHYTIVETGTPAVVYYNGAWQGAGPAAQWISVRPDGLSVPPRTYRTSFDLTGFNPDTAMLSGAWATDNYAYIFLNGAYTGVTLPSDAGDNFLIFHGFHIDEGFVAGLNTLDFYVVDQGEITGLGVRDLALTADVQAPGVPEPAAWSLLLMGAAVAGAALRRRRSASA